MDPSLLTISRLLSAIAKTLLHRGAVMIALLSWVRKNGEKRMIRERGSAMQLEVFHNCERSSATAEAAKLKKVFLKPKSHVNHPNSHLVSMVT